MYREKKKFASSLEFLSEGIVGLLVVVVAEEESFTITILW